MAIATAEQIRNRPILVPVPGSDFEIECRCPDPLVLISEGILPLETYGALLAKLHDVVESGSSNVIYDNRPVAESVADDPKTFFDMIDRWVCAAAVRPQIVLTDDEATADPSKLSVLDIDRPVKLEIVRRTTRRLLSPRLKTAVQEFRHKRSDGAGPGPDGAAVREDAVGAIASA